MRILYISFDDLSTPGAWSVHVKALVSGLVRRGHEIRVVSPGTRAPADLAGEFIPVRRRAGRLARAWWHLGTSLLTFIAAARGFAPQAIYCRGIHLSLTPLVVSWILRIPLYVEVNGLLEGEVTGVLRGVVRLSHRMVLKGCRRCITVTDRLRDALCRLYGTPADKIVVVPNGADPHRFHPRKAATMRKELGLPEAPTLVFAGSFYAHHALDLLPDLATRISKGVPSIHVVLVGTGSTYEAVREGIRRASLDGVVTFVGAVDHGLVPKYVSAGDVGLYLLRAPHPGFGFSPIKLFEYMACGLPVLVGADLPELREFVTSHGIGAAAELKTDDLAQAAIALLRDPGSRSAMGQRGRTLVEERYNWDRAAAAVEEVMQTCASR